MPAGKEDQVAGEQEGFNCPQRPLPLVSLGMPEVAKDEMLPAVVETATYDTVVK